MSRRRKALSILLTLNRALKLWDGVPLIQVTVHTAVKIFVFRSKAQHRSMIRQIARTCHE